MIKFVLDADAAIKLSKAQVLDALASFAKCVVTKQVYQEILKGKEKLYEDAFDIERLVDKGKITVQDIKAGQIEGLGIGECSALALFQKLKGNAIISDDRKFLFVLETQGVPFVIPTDVISMLFTKKRISKNNAIDALDKIRKLVREENYDAAKLKIGGK